MKLKIYPVTPVFLMAAFLFLIIFVSVNPCPAGSDKMTSPGVQRISGVEHTEAQIKSLQDALSITETQKAQWNSLTQVMRENAKDMDDLRKDKAANNKAMNAVERLKLHSHITEVRLNQLKKFIPTFETFYNNMGDEQKTIIDEIFHGRK